MKINIFDKKTLALLGCATLLAACSENSWNDNLDGFEVPGITQVETVSYTLTDEDYATLAGLSDNKALAGDGLSKALKAVGTQHYFTSEIPASKYVPAFLAATTTTRRRSLPPTQPPSRFPDSSPSVSPRPRRVSM